MKNWKRLFCMVIAALMLLGLCACGASQDEGGDALKGTWTRSNALDGEVVIKFDGKGNCEASWSIAGSPTKDKGTYTIESENTATVKLDGWSEAQSFTYEVDDKTLAITDNYSIFGGGFTKK